MHDSWSHVLRQAAIYGEAIASGDPHLIALAERGLWRAVHAYLEAELDASDRLELAVAIDGVVHRIRCDN